MPTLAADDDGEVFPARMTARVTSGYAFALLALDLTGQPLPGEWFAEKERDEEELISRSSRSASTSSSSSSPTGRVTLYGFEDDARNARDFAGGHSSTVCTGRRIIRMTPREPGDGDDGARADPTGSAASPCSRTSEEGGGKE